jgi:hypothetical protein
MITIKIVTDHSPVYKIAIDGQVVGWGYNEKRAQKSAIKTLRKRLTDLFVYGDDLTEAERVAKAKELGEQIGNLIIKDWVTQ